MADQQDKELTEIRERINAIDAQLVDLLSRRAEMAIAIGNLKGKEGRPFFTPEREREIFEKLARTNPGPLQTTQLTAIFREIVSAARAAERPISATYWGPPGTFSHMAAIATFGQSTALLPADSISDVFRAVEHGEADYGVVPLENSAAGIVPETLDTFPHTNVKICAEIYIPIHHHLVTTCRSLDEIERVYAGPQPAQQCRHWLRQNVHQAEIIDVAPTVKAIERAKLDPHGAALANSTAAELLEVPILAERVEDNPHNQTRFLVIGFNEPARTGRDKTTVMFGLRNQPGELYRALGAFDRFGVNLLMIESRRTQRFDYHFFLDCVGHRNDNDVLNALEALRQFTHDITILGSYPSQEQLS